MRASIAFFVLALLVTASAHDGHHDDDHEEEDDRESGRNGYGGHGQGYDDFSKGNQLINFNADANTPASGSTNRGQYSLTLNVTTSVAGAVSLTEVKSLGNLKVKDLFVGPGGFDKGYYVQIGGNGTISDVSLSVQVKAFPKMEGLGLFYISSADHFFGRVPFTATNETITYSLLLNSSALYFIASIPDNATVPSLFSIGNKINGGSRQKFGFDLGLLLNILNGANATLSVNAYSKSAATAPKGAVPLGLFFAINLSNQTALDAVITYQYNATLLPQLKTSPKNLRWALLNEAKGVWEFQDGNSVDTTNGVVTQKVSHFSQWAVYGESAGVTLMPLFALAAILSLLML